MTGESQPNVARWQAAFEEDRLGVLARELWRRGPDIEALLEPSVDAFALFRARYFRTSTDEEYLFPPLHRRWVASLLDVVERGGRQIILSPPRHGKSELLTHFCVWLICRKPNIRILWVSGNSDVASLMGGLIMEVLEKHELLAQDMLGPARSFQPSNRSGASWSPSEFTVGVRSVLGVKSPTFKGMGPSGRLLSRDADVIVIDDIVDEGTVGNPARRKRDLEWFTTQLQSRKTAKTALFAIGSRQHHDDLWGHIIESPGWDVTVEHQHDPLCELPRHAPMPANEHDPDCEVCAAHWDCMLFPDLAPMKDMQDKQAVDFVGMEDLFEMVHQNITRPEGAESLSKEDLAKCHSGRQIGDVPAGTRLIAGLDPAAGGWMATVLWAIDMGSKRRYLVDLDRTRDGGQQGALAAIQSWYFAYGLSEWVIEINGYQKAVLQDAEISKFCGEHGITLHPTYTSTYNKWDAAFGVPKLMSQFKAMAPSGEEMRPLVDLPWGDPGSQAKVRQLETELVRFSSTETKTHTGDLVMAAWFPDTKIRFWHSQEAKIVEAARVNDGYLPSTIGDMFGEAMTFSPLLVGAN